MGFGNFAVILITLQLTHVIHGTPSIEPCPLDSVEVAGTCKCNPESCSKPPCLSVLTVASSATDIPGNCCPTYSCVECKNETMIDGQCPCAPEAVLNSNNQCECVDKEKTLVDGKCVCDPDMCELPQVCDKKSVLVTVDDGCCKKTRCQPCPEDSYSTSYNSEDLEDKCVCFPCKYSCPQNETIVVLEPGTLFPGKCCDLYKCETIENKYCYSGTQKFYNGQEWETSDKRICKCQDGISLCHKKSEEKSSLEKACHVEGKIYKNNESWMEDACTYCTCINETTKCISHFCENKEGVVKKEECQPLANCNKTCLNGFKINRKGCEICKCNGLRLNQEDLAKYNISMADLIKLLEDWKKHGGTTTTTTTTTSTTTSTTTTPSTTIGNEIPTVPVERKPTMLVELTTPLSPYRDAVGITDHPNTTVLISDKKGYIDGAWWIFLMVGILIGLFLGGGLVCLFFVRRKQSKKNSLDITATEFKSHYHYEPVDNNNLITEKKLLSSIDRKF